MQKEDREQENLELKREKDNNKTNHKKESRQTEVFHVPSVVFKKLFRKKFYKLIEKKNAI